MKLQTLLTSIKNSQTTKTASEASEVSAAPAESNLTAALREAVAETSKVASANEPSPVEGVLKVAAELADAEQEFAVKEAALLGAAFADAAVARFADWQKAAAALPAAPMHKVASAGAQTDEVFAKFAEENPVMARQARALGYEPTAGGLEKMAEDSYVQGYNDQVSEIHKVASEEFLKGAALASILVEAAAK